MTRRILSAEINHETNTFSILPTTIDSYRARRFYRGDEIKPVMEGTRTEIGAHIDAAERYHWELIQPVTAQATPSGKTTAEAWARIKGAVIASCDHGPFDGMLLALHGAMVTEDQDDAEGDLLRQLRVRIGDDIPIAVTLDIHANVTSAMAEAADIVISYRTYPHIDHYEVATEAAHLLQMTMEGKIRPCAEVFRGEQLEGCDYGRTQGGPMSRILEKAEHARKNTEGLLAVAVCAGFPWSDMADTGPSVTLTTDGPCPAARKAAEELVAEIWNTRHEKTVREYTVSEAMKAATAPSGRGNGPLVLADFSDNPGAGGYGDGVGLLRAMIEANLQNAAFACVADPDCVKRCAAGGKGAEITVELGAKVDPKTYGPPLTLTGRVEHLSDGTFVCEGPMNAGVRFSMGPTAVLRSGGVRVIVATHNLQVYDRQFFKSQGIDPAACDVLAVKSWHHFRAAFQPISREVLLVDSGCLVSMDLKRFPYQKVRRPVYPLDLT
jgi:microcystin degradation protein MlrC